MGQENLGSIETSHLLYLVFSVPSVLDLKRARRPDAATGVTRTSEYDTRWRLNI